MVVRLVRMHFRPEQTETFLAIFNSNKNAIRNFPGCTHLELLRDVHSETTFTTLSHWEAESDLEAYRKSPLFGTVWSEVKTLFSARAEAYTFKKFINV